MYWWYCRRTKLNLPLPPLDRRQIHIERHLPPSGGRANIPQPVLSLVCKPQVEPGDDARENESYLGVGEAIIVSMSIPAVAVPGLEF
jgi:hypothetical protein